MTDAARAAWIAQHKPGLERALRLIDYERHRPLIREDVQEAMRVVFESIQSAIRYEADNGPLTSTTAEFK